MNLVRWIRIAIAATALAAPLVFACPSPGGPPCGTSGIASGARGNEIGVGAGNPINLITGNKYQREVDMAPLPGELGLEIVRHYNSSHSGAKAPLGLIGRGWRLSYETHLNDAPDNIQIIQGDGTLAIFPRDAKHPALCVSVNALDGKVIVEGDGKGRHYIWHWMNGRVLRFDNNGNLVMIEAPSGASVLLWYGPDGLLTRVADPQGRELTFEYGKQSDPGFHGVVAINTPVGRFAYQHPAPDPKLAEPKLHVGDLVRVTYPPAKSGAEAGRLYHFEDKRFPTLLTGISLVEGSKAAPIRFAYYGYDNSGLAVMSSHADGVNKVTISRSAPGLIVVTNSLGQKTSFRHALVSGEYRLLEVRGPGCADCGRTNVRYGYDMAARPTEITDLRNNGDPASSLRIIRDDLGRPIRYVRVDYIKGKAQPPHLLERAEYDGNTTRPLLVARPSVIPGQDHTLRMTYNSRGQIVTVTETGFAPAAGGGKPLSRTTTYRYTTVRSRSLLTEIDGPLPNGPKNTPADSDIIRLNWDAEAHFVTAVTLPGGETTALHYDDVLRLVEARSSHGLATKWTYDNAGNTISIKQGDAEYRASYGADGRLIETGVASRDGYRAQRLFGYDSALRPAWTVSQLGIVQRWALDTEGRIKDASTFSSRVKKSEHYTYLEDGKLASVTDQNGGVRQFAWNDNGTLAAQVDTLGRLTSFAYEGHRLTGMVRAAGDPLAELHVGIDSDEAGNRRAIDVGGVTTRSVVDDFGREIETASADSGRTLRTFDAADRLIAMTDALGNRAAYEFDLAGRIIRQTVFEAGKASPVVATWRYAAGRLVAIDHPVQSERFEHDPQGRLTARIVTLKLASGRRADYVTRYSFDALGQLDRVALPDGGALLYRRNAQGQVTAVEHQRMPASWLNWLSPAATLVRDIERDLVGIKRYMYGNGIEARYERSQEGALARVVHRLPGAAPRLAVPAASSPSLPGALGWPQDQAALVDLRYVWDTQGNLRERRDPLKRSAFAFDGQDRLIAAESAPLSHPTSATTSTDRYFYWPNGDRLLGQEGATGPNAQAATVKAVYAPSSSRLASVGSAKVALDAIGQPLREGRREYTWDALGRLSEVRQDGKPIATYRYNHRGERVEKRTADGTVLFLYTADGKVSAELDAAGRIKRQYVYLGDDPVAVIDTDSGAESRDAATGWARFIASVALKWNDWRGRGAAYTFLHNNHLGAPEMATGANREVRWHGSYANFGALRISASKPSWTLNLRLPGQYFDAETGLYYNKHRYYDPNRGRYLTPDPLGLRGGLNSYAYAAGNPMRNVDPSGLILFAFDGTGNSEHPPATDSISNVLKFYDAYDEEKNGPRFYITGIGTTNRDMDYKGNEYSGDGFDQRVALGFKFLNDFINGDSGTNALDIDVIGFSRGAAEARVWINLLAKKLKDDTYTVDGKARCINLRFEGLWDTVPHLGKIHGDEPNYDFSIPAAVKYAVQAVALNEHRGTWADFDLRSIMESPDESSSANRIEKGFIGSHSDIGGSYGTGDLSDVALMWMLDQAKQQGIVVDEKEIKDNGWDVVTNPILHDPSSNRFDGGDVNITRNVIYGNGDKSKLTSILQTAASFDGKRTADTHGMIDYFPDPYRCGNRNNPDVGLVNMQKYGEWLAAYGVPVSTGTLSNQSCR